VPYGFGPQMPDAGRTELVYGVLKIGGLLELLSGAR
jgi:hypothetical protein